MSKHVILNLDELTCCMSFNIDIFLADIWIEWDSKISLALAKTDRKENIYNLTLKKVFLTL